MLDKNIVVLSNFVGVFSALVAFRHRHVLPGIAVLFAMGASIIYHATEPGLNTTVWGTTLINDLEDGVITQWVLETSWGRWCRLNSNTLLLVDQLAALGAMATTVVSCGWPRPELHSLIARAIGFFILGEISYGWVHAMSHSLWHVWAFMIAERMMIGVK